MLQRTLPAAFIAPCLPTKTDKLPSGSQWLHEIKDDGFRIIARKFVQSCSIPASRRKVNHDLRPGIHLEALCALGGRGFSFQSDAIRANAAERFRAARIAFLRGSTPSAQCESET